MRGLGERGLTGIHFDNDALLSSTGARCPVGSTGRSQPRGCDGVMPDIRVLMPYFGPRPVYWPLLLRSMAASREVSWIIVTDEPVEDCPPNVHVEHETLDG